MASGEVKESTLSDEANFDFESPRKKLRIQMDCRDEVYSSKQTTLSGETEKPSIDLSMETEGDHKSDNFSMAGEPVKKPVQDLRKAKPKNIFPFGRVVGYPIYVSDDECTVCGEDGPKIICDNCDGKTFCSACDETYHKHSKRNKHHRKIISQKASHIGPAMEIDTGLSIVMENNNSEKEFLPTGIAAAVDNNNEEVDASSLAQQMDDQLNKQIGKNPFDGSHGVRKKVNGAVPSKQKDTDSAGRPNSVKPPSPVVSKTTFNTFNQGEAEPQAKITQWFAEEPLDLTKSKTENDPNYDKTHNECEPNYEDVSDDNENDEENVKCDTRAIPWIHSERTYMMPQEIWDKFYVPQSNTLDKQLFKYWKNKVGQDFDKHWECILILRSPRVGKNLVTIQGYCKHKGCRKFKFVTNTIDMTHAKSPLFQVYYSKYDMEHKIALVRQHRAVLRDEAKVQLNTCLPASFTRKLVDAMDEDMYTIHKKSIVPKDSVLQKIRSENVLSQDYAREDFEDMIRLQNATKDSPFIQKVISPYAVYIHSLEQLQTLVLQHKRKLPGTEVVGRLDATGNVVHVTPATSTHPVLYYPLVIAIKMDDEDTHSVLYPVTESLNSGHGVPDIGGWLHDFRESFVHFNPYINPILDRIISDFSYANFHGVLHSFQSMRLQEFIFICYKYAVGLEDFSRLIKIVKIHMCSTHLTKTLCLFVRCFFPSHIKTKKSTPEQKYITEVLVSLMICKPYNLIKEIFRNLCIILCNEYETTEVKSAKVSIAQLTEKELLLTPQDEFRRNFKHNIIDQEIIDEISEDESVYDLNESILKIPIYKGSPFYHDLKFICDDVTNDNDNENDDEVPAKNSLFKVKLIEDFMKQFGGILPLWTGVTLPKGIEKYDNQLGERHMLVAKDLLDEEALKVGYHKVKPTRFVKLLRGVIVSHTKRYRLRVPKTGKVQKRKDKDDSKVAKKVFNHMKAKSLAKVTRDSSLGVAIQNTDTSQSSRQLRNRSLGVVIENATTPQSSRQLRNRSLDSSYQNSDTSQSSRQMNSTHQYDSSIHTLDRTTDHELSKTSLDSSDHSKSSINTSVESSTKTIAGAKEGWSKATDKKRRFSYQQRSTILASLKSVKKGKPAASNKRKGSPVSLSAKRHRKTSENQSSKISKKKTGRESRDKKKASKKIEQNLPRASTKKTEKQSTIKNKFYNQLFKDTNYYLQLVSSSFNVGRIGNCKLMNDDYNSLKPETVPSVNAMEYILSFTLSQRYISLLQFANSILEEIPITLHCNIIKRICVMPFLIDGKWECYIIDCKKSTFCRVSVSKTESFDFKRKWEKFIGFYNVDKKHNTKLPHIQFWKEIPTVQSINTLPVDSGIFIIHYLYSLIWVVKDNFNATIFRETLMVDSLEYSDNVDDICLKCGECDDLLLTEKVDWTLCTKCKRWIHSSCINIALLNKETYVCKLCCEEEGTELKE